MKFKSFSDLATVLREVAAESEPAKPPMTPTEVRHRRVPRRVASSQHERISNK
jgi:hypothetical protein